MLISPGGHLNRSLWSRVFGIHDGNSCHGLVLGSFAPFSANTANGSAWLPLQPGLVSKYILELPYSTLY
jgi:hypothetical protein